MASQGGSLGADTFHQISITAQHICIMVNHLKPGAVKAGRGHALADGHTHRIGNALSQGSGGCLHSVGVTVFRVAGRVGPQLPEVLDVIKET